jgi:ATP-dependent helicase/nuclease subunit A
VGDIVVTGTIDRLLVEPDQIRFVDFKTSRRPPAQAEEIPAATWRQMAAYAAALETIYPGRAIRAGVLYTHTADLIALSDEVLARYKQDLSRAQESFGGSGPVAY